MDISTLRKQVSLSRAPRQEALGKGIWSMMEHLGMFPTTCSCVLRPCRPCRPGAVGPGHERISAFLNGSLECTVRHPHQELLVVSIDTPPRSTTKQVQELYIHTQVSLSFPLLPIET